MATAKVTIPTEPYTGPSAWYGCDLAAQPEKWVHVLTPEEIAAIEKAVDGVIEHGITFEAATKEDFDFGTFNAVLERMLQQIVFGIGFVVIRGLPVERCARVVAVSGNRACALC